ncbi:hypothetical protein ABB37_01187 [Leptomonas pyrrhocoris]|uniref:Uncharacterized protein n=1 Tax=Leptomonas pyrrhocoris TaxID=157538 RepID=A0A0M9G8A2_LEPPY|nr:hypothetical protein ABB37_01187 [Leptomonas pyrrhocoris]KPA84677.1 hypothetical protein ABB37_01187 [Leptomonas pyrrhocoris]|eukprot:XP_015663116.1 hypothetical protein ABB37_01187 [Leptomonas pyrrhocoris]
MKIVSNLSRTASVFPFTDIAQMNPSQRRCFLEVYANDDAEPRLLQLEPNVKLSNVLERFDEVGNLYWQNQPIAPEATPASLGMPCGIDQANTLWFVPTPPSYERPSAVWTTSQQTPLVESTAAMRTSPPSGFVPGEEEAQPPHQRHAPSLPAYFDATESTPSREPRVAMASNTAGAASFTPAPSWYSRPRLLSPARPAVAAAAASTGPLLNSPGASPLRQAPRSPAPPAAVASFHPPPAPPLLFAPQNHVAVQTLRVARPLATETRRNRPIRIDPEVLVDDVGPVELLRSELRRLKRDVEGLKHLQVMPRVAADMVASSPSPIPASSSADPSVEELAMELHDKQMRRLYEQRRFYLTHGQVAS